MKAIFTALNDATARLGIVISIAGAIAADDCLSNNLNDFLAEHPVEEIEDCLGELPDYLKEALESGVDHDGSFVEWALHSGKLGFILEVHTPSMDRGFYSWGMYFTQWVYADTFDEAVAKALEWVASVRANEQAKADQKGGAA